MSPYQTVNVRLDGPIATLQINRPEANNTINTTLVTELGHALAELEGQATVVVLEGLPEVFCFGHDFQALQPGQDHNGAALYDLWLRLATGPFVSVAHVRGKVNADGLGFVAACDLALGEETATFSLSELLFGLSPDCLLPFLVRRVGFQRAHRLALTTSPISAGEAEQWGLLDGVEPNSANLLRRHLLRLRRLDKSAVHRYKRYAAEVAGSLEQMKTSALALRGEVLNDPETLGKIDRYVSTGMFPWES